MVEARVDGRLATLEDAVAEAAACLRRARYPVITGLASDVAGIRSAIGLARALRCPFDHMASAESLTELNVMRSGGWMQISPGEVSRSCDLLLSVGQGIPTDLLSRLFPTRKAPRHLHIDQKSATTDLGLLRAALAGRPVKVPNHLSSMVEALKTAKFGVAVWSSGGLDEPTLEMLMGLVRDRNNEFRFSGMPLPTSGNGNGANLVSGWLTGFPVRTSFGRGDVEHDPWAFDAGRLIASGEADAALYLSSFQPDLPDWHKKIPTVALVSPGNRKQSDLHVLIEVGIPGLDHEGVIYSGKTGALTPISVAEPSNQLRASNVLDLILVALEAGDKAA